MGVSWFVVINCFYDTYIITEYALQRSLENIDDCYVDVLFRKKAFFSKLFETES